MTTAIRVSDGLIKSAKKYSSIDKRSIPNQIEHWAIIGRIAEENPDLSYESIKEILIGLEEIKNNERQEYKFG